jgi:hypothetical protein
VNPGDVISTREPFKRNGVAPAPIEDEPPRTIEHVGVDAIFAALPPVPWLCEGLRLAPGGVACLAGYGFSGKTVVAQSIALSVATGRHVFGVHRCKRGRVLHLDYEQGHRLTYERYQRLARGMGVTPDDIADRLRVAVFPTTYLDSPHAPDIFARTLEGFDLVIVDSQRAAAPTVDENSSEVRAVIDLLARGGDKTGALPMFLHHARKPGEGQMGGAKTAIRGSSAIYDACASVFVLTADKGDPTRVSHEKDRFCGVLIQDFGVRFEDVELGDDPRAGFRVVHLDREQLDARPSSTAGATLAKHAERIVTWLGACEGTFAGNKGALCDAIGMNRSAFFKALSTLEGSERIRVETTKRTGPRISLNLEVKA